MRFFALKKKTSPNFSPGPAFLNKDEKLRKKPPGLRTEHGSQIKILALSFRTFQSRGFLDVMSCLAFWARAVGCSQNLGPLQQGPNLPARGTSTFYVFDLFLLPFSQGGGLIFLVVFPRRQIASSSGFRWSSGTSCNHQGSKALQWAHKTGDKKTSRFEKIYPRHV